MIAGQPIATKKEGANDQETIEHTPGGPVIKIGDTWVFTGEWDNAANGSTVKQEKS